MNQILATNPIKQKDPISTHTIIKFFAISIIIFGICLISSGSYAVFKNQTSKSDDSGSAATNVASNSTNTADESNTTNDENSTEDNGIQIHLSVEGVSVKISVTGENTISFVTYKFDNNEETTREINNVSDEFTIDTPEGQHELTVTAVDVNNNSQVKQIKVSGVTNPTVDLSQDGDNLIISASDEIGLDRIEFYINGKGFFVRCNGDKEKAFSYPLEDGDNSIQVKIYNTNNATAEKEATFSK